MKNMNEEFLFYNIFYVFYSEDLYIGNEVSYLIDLIIQNIWYVLFKWSVFLEYQYIFNDMNEDFLVLFIVILFLL